MKPLLISATALAALTGAAIAQTTVVTPSTSTSTEYYVVRDTATKKCTIVDQKPTATTTTVVDNGIFKTRLEAESGMKTTKVCTDN